MKTKTLNLKSGKKAFLPIICIEELEDFRDENRGFCIACGETAFGVEPDARKYLCECCGTKNVYGFEELVIMGFCEVE